MKYVLDACVLYPTVMREMLLGAARLGHFTPLWSERLLEEWARAARQRFPEQEPQARAEIALLRDAFPEAMVPKSRAVEARLWLPDKHDIHVLATAVAASADAIVTLNKKDFPRGLLAEEGVGRTDPDTLLYQCWLDDTAGMDALGQKVLDRARAMSGEDWQMRALMKKARMPRLAKALASGQG